MSADMTQLEVDVHPDGFSVRANSHMTMGIAHHYCTGGQPTLIVITPLDGQGYKYRAAYTVDGVKGSVEFLVIGQTITYLEKP